MTTPTLAYWKIRGLAQSIRMFLLYTETEFEDKYYVCQEIPPYDRSEWTNLKETLGLDFPNLPYFIDGDIKITQSNAILMYLGRKHDLVGKTNVEKTMVDMMLEEAMDFRNRYVMLCYFSTPDTIQAKKEYFKKDVTVVLKRFDDFLSGKKMFISNEVTIIDFVMYELFDQHRISFPTLLDSYDNIQKFIQNFETDTKLAAVLKSNKLFKGPMNNPQSLIN